MRVAPFGVFLVTASIVCAAHGTGQESVQSFSQLLRMDFEQPACPEQAGVLTLDVPPAAPIDLGPWPQGCSPREIGERVAGRFLQRSLAFSGRREPAKHITYPETCTWYGALMFARLTGDTALQMSLLRRFEPLFNERKDLVPVPDHVDYTVFAAVPLEISIETNDPRCLELGKDMADRQWGAPFGPNASEEAWIYFKMGLTWQTRLWIDDMFMITAVQAQAYRATGDRRYIDRAAKEMVVYLDSLQKPNGLFYHAPDVPFFWGRGNGWVAAGLSELLRSLPDDNPDRPRIMEGYRAMMASLVKHQDAGGMWHQLIDQPESWPETSCSAMFTFAMISGVKSGWLDQKMYAPAARKGWLAVIKYINEDGDIREVCEGTGKKDDRQYYLDRKRNVGDLHGQAPLLWCAAALLR
jgi:unsaturated rhamnogalacturonyl hydrolase